MPTPTQRVAAKAVIVKDGAVLMLRETSAYGDGSQTGNYIMPGGRIEPGENYQTALKREVREEAGIEIEIGRPLYVAEWMPVINGQPQQVIAIHFLCTPLSTEVVLDAEHDDAKWVSPSEYKKYPMPDTCRGVFENLDRL